MCTDGKMTWDELASENTTLKAQVERLRKALEELMEWWNGPPLPSYEQKWNAAMDEGYATLAETAPKTEETKP